MNKILVAVFVMSVVGCGASSSADGGTGGGNATGGGGSATGGGSGATGGGTGGGSVVPMTTVKVRGGTTLDVTSTVTQIDLGHAYGLYIGDSTHADLRMAWPGGSGAQPPLTAHAYTSDADFATLQFTILDGDRTWDSEVSFSLTLTAWEPAAHGTLTATLEEQDGHCCASGQSNPVTVEVDF